MKEDFVTNNAPDAVPYIVYENAQVRNARRERVHWYAHFAMLLAMILVIGGFIWYLNQYEYVSNESVTVDGADGVANYVGKDGTIYNGEDYSKTQPLKTQEERSFEGNP